MKDNDPRVKELYALLDESYDGTISDQSVAKLNELLHSSQELVWEYLCYVEVHSSLGYGLGQEISPATIHTPATCAPPLDVEHNFQSSLWAAIVIVLLCVVCFIGRVVWQSDDFNKVASVQSRVVARLVDTVDCQWVSTPQELGADLYRDDAIELSAGLVCIRCSQGASVVLQGPGRLVVSGVNSITLHHGTVTSRVPPEAKGFIVDTPSSRIVDYGTEFGTSVNRDGGMALSVFEGVVEVVNRRARNGVGKRLVAGQSMRLDRSGRVETFNTVDPKQFGLVRESRDKSIDITVGRLRSAKALCFKGELVTAVNVGDNETISVRGVTFIGDDGQYVSSPVRATSWGTRPWLGNLKDDVALANILTSICHNHIGLDKGPGEPVAISVAVPNGRYRLQLLLSENYHVQSKFRDRSINIDIEGQPCIRDLRTLAVQGIAGYPVPPTQAILIRCDVDVNDGTLNATLFSHDIDPTIDCAVILNAMAVERITSTRN